MFRRVLGRFLRAKSRLAFRLFGGSLRGPIGRIDDQKIDADLARLGLDRERLFLPETVTTRHRWRMARMMARHRVDVRRLLQEDWKMLKFADNRCAYCESAKRCERWLDLSLPTVDGPLRFCPNGALFADLGSRPR